MYNSYLKSASGSLLGCLHGKHLHLVMQGSLVMAIYKHRPGHAHFTVN